MSFPLEVPGGGCPTLLWMTQRSGDLHLRTSAGRAWRVADGVEVGALPLGPVNMQECGGSRAE